jgi:quinol monooxygenase YgiN
LSVAPRRRREFLAVAGAAAVAPLAGPAAGEEPSGIGGPMFGLIGKVSVVPGQREALAKVLLEGTQAMPGCLGYVVASDPADADALWITEVWESRDSHQASLSLPAVQAAIAKGRPLIAGFGARVETVPIGGYGLRRAEPR